MIEIVFLLSFIDFFPDLKQFWMVFFRINFIKSFLVLLDLFYCFCGNQFMKLLDIVSWTVQLGHFLVHKLIKFVLLPLCEGFWLHLLYFCFQIINRFHNLFGLFLVFCVIFMKLLKFLFLFFFLPKHFLVFLRFREKMMLREVDFVEKTVLCTFFVFEVYLNVYFCIFADRFSFKLF